jgi:hypothetical protein
MSTDSLDLYESLPRDVAGMVDQYLGLTRNDRGTRRSFFVWCVSHDALAFLHRELLSLDCDDALKHERDRLLIYYSDFIMRHAAQSWSLLSYLLDYWPAFATSWSVSFMLKQAVFAKALPCICVMLVHPALNWRVSPDDAFGVLVLACKADDVNMARLAVQAGADMYARRGFPLTWAIKHQSTRVLRALDPNITHYMHMTSDVSITSGGRRYVYYMGYTEELQDWAPDQSHCIILDLHYVEHMWPGTTMRTALPPLSP